MGLDERQIPIPDQRTSRRRVWPLFAMAAIGIVFVLILAWRATVPTYQGKTVYDWMLVARSSDLASNPGLNAIGSNAVPYLARALAMRNSPYDRYSWVRKPRVQNALTNYLGHGLTGLSWTMPSKEIRRAATWSLLAFGFEAKAALPELHAELLNPQAAERQMVIFSLSELGPLPESVPFLVKAWPLTTNETYVIRRSLLHALGRAGTNAMALGLPIALVALQDPEAEVQKAAADVFARWGSLAPASVPKLITMLSSKDSAMAALAAGAICRVTNRADEALPALRKLSSSTDDYTRAVTAMALWRLGGPAEETRHILEALLSGKLKGMAAAYLGSMGPAGKDSVPALLRSSHLDIGNRIDMYDRAQCARAVLRIQGESAEALGVLAEALAYKSNGWVRETVAIEIGKLGPTAIPLIPDLQRAVQDPNRKVRHEAALALAKLKSTR